MCVVGLLVPATLMAKVEKVTLKGTIKGLGNEELILMNSDRSEITRTKTKNDRDRSGDWGSTLLYSLCAIGGSIRTFYGNSYDSLFY